MNTNLDGRPPLIATGAAGSPFHNAPILRDAPALLAVYGNRYGNQELRDFVSQRKAECPGSRRVFFTILGPNHIDADGAFPGITRAWTAVDTAEMYSMFDLMTLPDAGGATGSVMVTGFFTGPNAPADWAPYGANHDRAVRDYMAAHPDRDVHLVAIDPAAIQWPADGDGIHPAVGSGSHDPLPSGEEDLIVQVYAALVALHPELAATGSPPVHERCMVVEAGVGGTVVGGWAVISHPAWSLAGTVGGAGRDRSGGSPAGTASCQVGASWRLVR